MEYQTQKIKGSDPRRALFEGLKKGYKRFTCYNQKDGGLIILPKRDIKDWRKILQRMRGY